MQKMFCCIEKVLFKKTNLRVKIDCESIEVSGLLSIKSVANLWYISQHLILIPGVKD